MNTVDQGTTCFGKAGNEIGMGVLKLLEKYEKPMNKTRIHKTFFIMTKDMTRLAPDFDFKPDDYGPFSQVLESTLRGLKNDGLVYYNEKSKYAKPVSLETEGKIVCDEEGNKLDKEIIERFPDYIEIFEGLEHDEMLAFVDSMFPEMAVNSKKFKNEIEPHLQTFIVNLINKEKITVGRGAQLLKIPYSEMKDHLRE